MVGCRPCRSGRLLVGWLVLAGATNAQDAVHELLGESPGDLFGRSVTSISDFNNDGVPEFLVGSRSDLGNGLPGRVYQYSGADGSLMRTWTGDLGARFGISVRDAGDVNGDTVGDIVIGASRHAAGGTRAGRVFIYSGVDGGLIRQFDGAAGDQLGYSVYGAGDLDGDGYSEIIASGYTSNTGADTAGTAVVYSGVDGSVMYEWFGENIGDHFGFGVAAGSDVSGDGVPDFVVGARLCDTAIGVDSGRIYVYSGATGLLLYAVDGAQAGEFLGSSVALLGDLDGDQLAEVGAGAVAGANGEGRTVVLSGSSGTQLYNWVGDALADFFGSSISSAGDVNTDGVADVVVGASAFLKEDVAPGATPICFPVRPARFSGASSGKSTATASGSPWPGRAT